jgi:predicted O-methyltransferase YrrM
MSTLAKRVFLAVKSGSGATKRVAAKIARGHSAADPHDSYAYLKPRFILNGQTSRFSESIRSEIVRRFEEIDRNVPMGTTATDGLFLAEMLLNAHAAGTIVECGCYAGASSAKLSILANLLERQLVIFDSFAGLPAVDEQYLRDKHCRRGESWVTDWTAGRYAAQLETVKSNVSRFGEIASCKFVQGWFSQTLNDANLPARVLLAFVDVDLADSARDCFVALWPRVADKGVYVTHDAAYIKVLQELYNPDLWMNTFKAIPPILFGAGYGLCDSSPHIGYMVKGEALSTDYLKSLTIDK